MKSFRFVLLAVPMLLICCAKPAISQTHDHQAAEAASPDAAKPAAKAPPTEAQKSFTELKTLAGVWRGRVTLDPPMKGMGDADLEVTMRVASRGNTIVHELQEADKPFDATKYDHPITMLYLDEDRLMLTHYCDAGNRPRMTGKLLPDGKTVQFDYLDIAGPTKYGHMKDAKFTVIDANHHIEEWWFEMPGNKVMHARMDLQRKPDSVVASAGK